MLLKGLLLALCVASLEAWGQTVQLPTSADTLRRQQLREVVVTATRTEKTLAEVPIPVTVVGARQMRAMGSLRLNDVLGEQTGLQLVADHGRGIQLQGLSPEYTLILVDGEPLIGRTAGTLELSRVAVGNLARVEIVKGPASALWGSDALAGVVNLITAAPRPGTDGSLRLRYGSNRTADASASFNTKGERAGLTVFLNRYSSAGYTLQPESSAPTVPPFAAYTAQSRLSYALGPRTTLRVSGRYFSENQSSTLAVSGNGNTAAVRYASRQQDYSLTPTLTHRFGPQQQGLGTLRLYHAGYRTRENYTYAADGRSYDATFFNQTFSRAEGQVDYELNARHRPTVGAGYLLETVEATRYDQRQALRAPYAFAQHDWTLRPGLNLVLGARYDGHSQYAGQLSPKLAGRWQVLPKLALRASAGRGYRAPDFRQLYLNFSNPVVGYSVFGSRQVQPLVEQLRRQGQLALDPATGQPILNQMRLEQAGTLRPESSQAYNAGLQYDPTDRLTVSLNLFRNDLRDLIETTPVAQKTNGQSVFTYSNVSQAYTQGLEAEARYELRPGLTLSGGYQLLDARDKAVLDQLAAGSVYRRDPATLATERVPASDYGGLFNRSRHSANAKLFYESPRRDWTASVRGIYRGRYGWQDLNGNAILDQDAEYVRGYAVWNVAAGKTWRQRYTLQAGLDNALGYRDPTYLPTLPGRLWYASLEVALRKPQPAAPN
jgi:outer membrane receptor for ferrienterochelin and colicins